MARDPMIDATSRYPVRALVAHVLMVLLYVLAVLASVGLVVAPVVAWLVLDEVDARSFGATLAGVVLLRVLVPDPVRFEPVRPPIGRADQPELFDVLEMVCAATRQPAPDDVYLVDDVAVWLVEVGGVLGVGRRRALGIGAPLMSVLDTEQFGATIADQLCRARRDGGRVAAHVCRVRQVVRRQVVDVRRSWFHRPTAAFGRAYLRATRPIADARERAAVLLAERATSARAVGGAAAALPFGAAAYALFRASEYRPLLECGRRPPLLAGFEAFLASPAVAAHLARDEPGRPAIVLDRARPEVTAAALLRDVDAIEHAFARSHLAAGASLRPIAWKDVGTEVLVPSWRSERRELVGDLPPGFHLGALPVDRAGLVELGEDVAARTGAALDSDGLLAQGHRAARAIIGELAASQGFAVEMSPGEPLWFGRPPEQYGLLAAYDAVVEGRDHPSHWFELLDEAGLPRGSGHVPVAAPAPASSPPPADPAPVRDPTPTRPAPARPSPPPPLESHRRKVFHVPAAMGRSHDLVIDGDTVAHRGSVVAADDVTHVAYWSGDDAEVRLWADERLLRIKLAGGQRSAEVNGQAWEAVVAWIDARVAPRLVGRAMAQLTERGRVQVGDQVVTASGVVVRGRVVPWSVLAGAALDGRMIQIRQRIDGDPRGTVIATLDASEPNLVLVPPLMVAASTAAVAGSPSTAAPEHAH